MNTYRFPLPHAFLSLWFLFAAVSLSRGQTEVPPRENPPLSENEKAPALRRLDQGATPAVAEKPAAPAEPAVSAKPASEAAASAVPEVEQEPAAPPARPVTREREQGRAKTRNSRSPNDHSNDFPFGDHALPVNETAREIVSIMGSNIVDGLVENETVSILGDTTINGRVRREVVVVGGTAIINGVVDGKVTVVGGNIEMGPEGVVDGKITVVGGKLNKAPSAVVHGRVEQVGAFGIAPAMTGLRAWFHQCLMYGRPLAIGPNLGWVWSIAAVALAFYILVGFLFPGPVRKCVETLEQRPGKSLLAAVAVVVLTPILLIIMTLTVVGVPVAIFALFVFGIFGRVVMHAWLGSRFTRYLGDSPLNHVALSVLVGGVMITLLYLVPVLGLVLWKVLGLLGLGVVIYTLILNSQRSRPVVSDASASPAMPLIDPTASGVPLGAPATAPVPPPMTSPTRSVALASLPRAGFWIRAGALILDLIVVGLVTASLGHAAGKLFFLLLASYAAVLWKLKGATLGGIICGLKVVRLDDRPIDWSVAIVRALGCFISLVVAGLGFIWVAFDDERQSWHDKIAGTTVVLMPKGNPLL
jgi:uncharacterized RDD family membrane protein YckC